MAKKIDLKAAQAELDELRKRADNLELLIKSAREREPKKLNYTLMELVAAIKTDALEEELVVGDYIEVNLLSLSPIQIYVIGKNHDVIAAGKKAKYTFGFAMHDIRVQMNETSTNSTSWKDSKMRKQYAESMCNLLLTKTLASALTPVVKKTSAGSESGKIIETMDSFFLLSQVEITGGTSYSKHGEGEQYEFFKDADNRKKVLGSNWVWTRSPYWGGSFCVVDGDDSDYDYADYFYGVFFGFCV